MWSKYDADSDCITFSLSQGGIVCCNVEIHWLTLNLAQPKVLLSPAVLQKRWFIASCTVRRIKPSAAHFFPTNCFTSYRNILITSKNGCTGLNWPLVSSSSFPWRPSPEVQNGQLTLWSFSESSRATPWMRCKDFLPLLCFLTPPVAAWLYPASTTEKMRKIPKILPLNITKYNLYHIDVIIQIWQIKVNYRWSPFEVWPCSLREKFRKQIFLILRWEISPKRSNMRAPRTTNSLISHQNIKSLLPLIPFYLLNVNSFPTKRCEFFCSSGFWCIIHMTEILSQ